MDRSQSSRDLVDLAMMIGAWGPIPTAALQKAEAAYAQAVYRSFDRALALLRDTHYRSECLKAMAMSPALGESIVNTLENNPPTPAPQS